LKNGFEVLFLEVLFFEDL